MLAYNVSKETAGNAKNKILHNLFERGNVSSQKLLKLGGELTHTNSADKETIAKLCNKLKKYDMPYSVVSSGKNDKGVEQYHISYQAKYAAIIGVVANETLKESLKEKDNKEDNNKSVNDNIYAKAVKKQQQKQAERNEPIKHKEVGVSR